MQRSQHGHRNAHRDLWKTRLCLPSPFSDPHVPEAHSGTGLGKSWGPLQHSHGWYRLPDVSVNRAPLSALTAKDSRLLTMHLVLGTLSQSLHGDTEGANFMWEYWRSLQLSERCPDIYIGISPPSSCPKYHTYWPYGFEKKIIPSPWWKHLDKTW